MKLLEEVTKTALAAAREHKLWTPGDTIAVAVSGGPDSVALLHVLDRIGRMHTELNLVCFHANHGFRPESAGEAELVRGIAEELGIPFEMAELDIPSYMKESGKGSQEAARERRYAFLLETAGRYGAQAVALAHHADDQAETVLMRLMRGSGLTGLAGMRWKREERGISLIRPLLGTDKQTLLQLCGEQDYRYAVDASNGQTKYRRNAVRLEALPLLERMQPGVSRSLWQFAEMAADEDDYMQAEASRLFAETVTPENGRYILKRGDLAAVPSALQRRLIKLILNYLSAEASSADYPKVEAIRKGILKDGSASWQVDLGAGLTCMRQYDTVIFSPKPPEAAASYTYLLSECPSRVHVKETGAVVTLSVLERKDFEERFGSGLPHGLTAWFDGDELAMPLTVRSRLPGDTIKVMGLNGSKKVKDIFIDEKIPLAERSRIPLVCDGLGNIVWIPGVRRSMHAPLGRHTARVIVLTLGEEPGH